MPASAFSCLPVSLFCPRFVKPACSTGGRLAHFRRNGNESDYVTQFALEKDPGGRWRMACTVVVNLAHGDYLEVNTIAVYIEAVDGSLVSGQASDTAEVALVGYRLDIVREPAVTSAALCSSVAAAVIEKTRLEKIRGALSALPNCGTELFDVVEVTDRWANLRGTRFRVSAISLSYNRDKGTIVQKLVLGAV